MRRVHAAVLGRAVRNRHRHAIEQASRRWRGGQRDDSARTRRKNLISTKFGTQIPPFVVTSAGYTPGAQVQPAALQSSSVVEPAGGHPPFDPGSSVMGSCAGSWAGAGAGSWAGAGAGAGAAAVSSEGVSMRLMTPRPFATVPAIEPRTKDRAIAATTTFLSVEDLGFGSCRSGWLSADVMVGRPARRAFLSELSGREVRVVFLRASAPRRDAAASAGRDNTSFLLM